MIDALGSGGAERQMSYLAKELHLAGHDVKLVTFYNSDMFYADAVQSTGVNLEVHPEGASIPKRVFLILKLVKSFKPDMVIAYKDGASMSACMAKLLADFRLTVSERNTTQTLTKKERLKFFLYRFADHIVPNSYSQADFIISNYPSLAGKVKVITNMIDENRFTTVDKSILENKPLRILTTARIVPQKNPKIYLQCIAELKRRRVAAYFDWFGAEDNSCPGLKAELLTMTKDLGIETMVSFFDPEKNIEKEYHSHDIFLLPSRFEGFPNVLCEAMACGMPAVATNVCDSPKILTDAKWHVNPDSYMDMADKLEFMIKMAEEERHDIGKKNASIIKDLCSSESFVKQYTALM